MKGRFYVKKGRDKGSSDQNRCEKMVLTGRLLVFGIEAKSVTTIFVNI